ncbi:hypothetical protein C8R45DRAFT_1108504 [Mycena sanguinolenta]|nr:hypothetical protein C8R45DRAFT_1108504 [Mycena sanguinolenta]
MKTGAAPIRPSKTSTSFHPPNPSMMVRTTPAGLNITQGPQKPPRPRSTWTSSPALNLWKMTPAKQINPGFCSDWEQFSETRRRPRLIRRAPPAKLKHSETLAPGAAPKSLPLTNSADVVEEESAGAPSDPQEAARDEETMTLRMRRLEAQMGALLAIGLPEGSAPSYSG